MDLFSANSRFAVQNDETYLPRITRETCIHIGTNILLDKQGFFFSYSNTRIKCFPRIDAWTEKFRHLQHLLTFLTTSVYSFIQFVFHISHSFYRWLGKSLRSIMLPYELSANRWMENNRDLHRTADCSEKLLEAQSDRNISAII